MISIRFVSDDNTPQATHLLVVDVDQLEKYDSDSGSHTKPDSEEIIVRKLTVTKSGRQNSVAKI